MQDHEESTKMSFSTRGAWLGLVAYLVLIIVVSVIYTAG
jgi:hypothetical protein